MFAQFWNESLNKTQRILILLYVIFQLLDVVTTQAGLAAGLSEGNAIPAMILQAHGEQAFYLSKMALTLCLLGVAVSLSGKYERMWIALRLMTILTCVVVVSNLMQVIAVAS